MKTKSLLKSLSFLAVTFFFLSPQGWADVYFNSAEPGCDGTDPTVLWCDDFEDGSWYYHDCNGTDASDDGWCGNVFYPADPVNGSAVCSGAGAAGTNCTATTGFITGGNGKRMGDHGLSGATGQTSGHTNIYFRYYRRMLPGFIQGFEKWWSINFCGTLGNTLRPCTGWGGIQFSQIYSWPGIPAKPVLGPPHESFSRNCNMVSCEQTPGNWTYFEVHIVLNSVGQSNGLYELWMNDCGADGSDCQAPNTPTLRARHTDVMFRTTDIELGSLWMENWSQPISGQQSIGELRYDQIKAVTGAHGQIGFMTASAPKKTQACTDGVDCYCDRVKNPNDPIYDPNAVLCEDFEAVTLHEDVNVGGGAPLYGPWYDNPTGNSGFRGGNNYWQKTYPSPTGGCGWSNGDPATPLRGNTCAFGVCGPKEWREDNLWQGNKESRRWDLSACPLAKGNRL